MFLCTAEALSPLNHSGRPEANTKLIQEVNVCPPVIFVPLLLYFDFMSICVGENYQLRHLKV